MGIPPAPRGVPQIEVSFDIDANGIVHVSAKDLATGTEQKIRIESSSGLDEADIERMVKEAEDHAEDDKQRRQDIETRNNADTLLYTTEKTLNEHGDKIPETDRDAIKAAIEELRTALGGEDVPAIAAASEKLTQASHKLAEAMYAAASQAQQGAAGGAEGAGAQGAEYVDPGAQAGEGGQGDTVDADYTVVDDEDKEDA